jgi:hypothetical protein
MHMKALGLCFFHLSSFVIVQLLLSYRDVKFSLSQINLCKSQRISGMPSPLNPMYSSKYGRPLEHWLLYMFNVPISLRNSGVAVPHFILAAIPSIPELHSHSVSSI